jgi:SNF family Na+-dependent transporter
MPEQRQSEQWGTKIGAILAVSGSAVGLGNFLRFPGKAAEYGGGSFMIPYFISLLILGIPICWVEWTIGRQGGRIGFNSSPGIMAGLLKHKVARLFGTLGLLIPVIIYMYYVYIEAWCLAYAYDYLTGRMNNVSQYGDHFSQLVGTGANGFTNEGGGFQRSIVFLAIVFTINFMLIYRGLTKGIETFCKWAMPLMILSAIIVLFRVLTLGTPDSEMPDRNVLTGLGFMWNPKAVGDSADTFGALWNPQTWLEAAGQIFFSLSVGFGIITTYASYLRRNDDVVLSGLTASATNEFCEVCLGGLITIPAAFIFLGATGIEGAGTFGLGFTTLPEVFARMPAGQLFGFLWFFMLFLAAITSSLSMLQPAIAFLEEGFGLKRKGSVTILSMITALGTLVVVYFSKDMAALDTMDFWVGSFFIYILATFLVIMFGWVIGVDRGVEMMSQGADLRVPKGFKFVIKYVSPTYLIAIFAFWGYQNAPGYAKSVMANQDVQFTVVFMLIVAIFLFALVTLAHQRWIAEGRATLLSGEGAMPVTSSDSENTDHRGDA